MSIEIFFTEDSKEYYTLINLFDLIRKDNIIVERNYVFPSSDNRFEQFNLIQELFDDNDYAGKFESNNVKDTVDKLGALLKIVFKINDLKTFW